MDQQTIATEDLLPVVRVRRRAAEIKMKLILVVDDDDDTIALVESIGRKAGYRVLGAASGEECLAMLPRVAPHLILLDVNMTRLDGFETCRRVRVDPNGTHVPIAFLTGRKAIEDVKRGVVVGGDEFIVKPFDPRQLVERIEFMLSRTHQLSAHRQRRATRRGPPGAWLPVPPRRRFETP